MINGPYERSQLQKLKAGKPIVHNVPGRPGTGSSRPGTLERQGVDSQVDPLCSVPGRPPGLGGRPRTLGIIDSHMAGNILNMIHSVCPVEVLAWAVDRTY